LRIPVNDTGAELRSQLINFTLVLVDLLNEKGLGAAVPKVKGKKGIAKLERFLKTNSCAFVGRDISLLRRIQNIPYCSTRVW